MENPIKVDDLGVPLFLETSTSSQIDENSVTHIDLSWLYPRRVLSSTFALGSSRYTPVI